MLQKIHPWVVILVPNLSLMWADQLKKNWQQFRPYIKKSMVKVSNHPTQGQQMEFVFKNWSCFLTRYNCTAVNRSGNESYQVSINNNLAGHCLIHALLNNNNNMIWLFHSHTPLSQSKQQKKISFVSDFNSS